MYYWDLSGVSSDPAGKRHSVRAEISGDPKWADLSSIYTVETVLHEDFETITDLTADGWVVHSYEFPVQTYTGWYIGNDPVLGTANKCSKSLSTYSTTFYYRLFTPSFTLCSIAQQFFIKSQIFRTNHGRRQVHKGISSRFCREKNMESCCIKKYKSGL